MHTVSIVKPAVGSALLAAALWSACSIDAAAIDGAGIRSFTVESDPSGAEVITITGRHGTTPATLDERDIFPNSYPPEDISQYGIVTLRRDGCRDLNIRPGEEDIVRGLSLQLDCERNAGTDAARTTLEPEKGGAAPQAPGKAASGIDDRDRASKKLEQLRLLQELLEEGLITAEEEAVIRRRILQQP